MTKGDLLARQYTFRNRYSGARFVVVGEIAAKLMRERASWEEVQ